MLLYDILQRCTQSCNIKGRLFPSQTQCAQSYNKSFFVCMMNPMAAKKDWKFGYNLGAIQRKKKGWPSKCNQALNERWLHQRETCEGSGRFPAPLDGSGHNSQHCLVIQYYALFLHFVQSRSQVCRQTCRLQACQKKKRKGWTRQMVFSITDHMVDTFLHPGLLHERWQYWCCALIECVTKARSDIENLWGERVC